VRWAVRADVEDKGVVELAVGDDEERMFGTVAGGDYGCDRVCVMERKEVGQGRNLPSPVTSTGLRTHARTISNQQCPDFQSDFQFYSL
jgi:hypothetical protein